MSYRNLDINLLPPELRPGPAVRYRVIIIWAIVLVTLSFLMIDSFFSLSRISQKRESLDIAMNQVAQQGFIEEEHTALMGVENYVMKTGRLVSMASADYMDLPLVAGRIAGILPDGVFLERITNNRPGKGSNTSDLSVVLVSSKDSPDLVLETFNRFKEDAVLGNCYMRVAEQESRSLSQLLTAAGAKWEVSGPEIASDILANHYAFEIHSLVTSPVDDGGAKVIFDDSKYLAGFQRGGGESAVTAEKSAEGVNTPPATTAPSGVEVEEAY